MKKVLLAQPISENAVKFLKEKVEVMVSPDPEDSVVRAHLKGCHGLIIRTGTRLSRETIMTADSLEVISRTGAGTDNIDIEAATEKGIPVCNTPDANTLTVAEHTLGLLLCMAKQIGELNTETRVGNWKIRDTNSAMDLESKILGLIGFGRIGQKVVRLALAFRMEVYVFDPFLKDTLAPGIKKSNRLEDILKISDFISLHAPLTDKTKNMLAEKEFALMKKGAIILNTSRGGLISEKDLIEALKMNRLGGAGLDVFQDEPLGKENPLCSLNNVILTPHTAALTKECKARVAMTAVRSALDVLEGRQPQWVVNKDKLKG